jgi:small conductance mechanosensitive channel
MNDLGGQLMELYTNYFLPLLTTWGLRAIGGVAVLAVGLMFARSVRRALTRVFDKTEMDVTLEKFLTSLFYYLIMTMAGVAALGMMGIQMASVLTIMGAAGLAVGLALQGTLSNVAAGVMLLIFRPFKVGDYVDAGGTAGTIDTIGLFATTLNTPDNIHIIVPNSGIYGGTIRNFSHHETRRNDMVVGISYDDDIGLAMDTIRSILDAEDRVLKDPEYVVAVSELADSSVNIVVRPWCKAADYWNLRFDLTRTFKERLEAAGCSIPYPQRDVHLHNAE